MSAVDLDALLTAAQAAHYFRVSREVIYQRIRRAARRDRPIEVRDRKGPRNAPRYRLGDLLEEHTIAMINDTGGGRGRSAPAA